MRKLSMRSCVFNRIQPQKTFILSLSKDEAAAKRPTTAEPHGRT